ncbi:MAG TPA: hypothetical protein PK668_22970 [Myxococcota bacterium]|nr:hypothetical protein [Myxococcota bacterium]HRY95558.1 hypothetical protein [Myxococcota bacterium]
MRQCLFTLLLLVLGLPGVLTLACSPTPDTHPCVPDCEGMECGDDGCGGSCGGCGPTEECVSPGRCQCAPVCGRQECGLDSVCGVSCGDCSNFYSEPMCCVDVGGDFKVCLKIDPGYACGNQDKTCGQSCVGQLDSACAPDHACLSGADVYCSHPCVTNADCNDCQAEDPDTTFQCAVIGGGDSYCIAANDDTCTASSHCDAGEACSPYIDETGDALQGYCVSGGTLTAGAECDEDDDQCMGMCINAHCSEVCETDGDCPEQNTCMSVSFCKTLEGTGDCATCTEAFPDIKMCIWYPLGTQPAGAPCASGAIHADAGDCIAGLTCLDFDLADPPCATIEDCTPLIPGSWNAGCVPGACGVPSHCAASFCSSRCDLAGACQPGFVPIDPSGECYCAPSP